MSASGYKIRELSDLTPKLFWAFSLDYYERQGVKDACLMLQNKYNGNVNLLLLMCWLDSHQWSLESRDFTHLNDTMLKHQSQLVEFRQIRKQAKRHIPVSLYQDMLQYELGLEKQQQHELVALIKDIPLAYQQTESMIEHYCRHLNAESLLKTFHHAMTHSNK